MNSAKEWALWDWNSKIPTKKNEYKRGKNISLICLETSLKLRINLSLAKTKSREVAGIDQVHLEV